MGVRIEKPRSDNYNLFLAALDRYGNYSEPLEFTINHPGIQQLELSSQDVTGLIGSIKINLPKVYTQRSQEVYPEEVANEEKEILGYRIHLQEVDYNTEEPIGEEEIVDYDAKEINEKGIIYYQTETGKKYKIKIGAYDSVYHPDFNYDLYEQTISQTVVNSTMKIERPDISEALIKPNDLTTTLQGTGLTASDFEEGGIESTYTIQAGVWDDTNNKPVVGGIGLAYNEDDNDIDVQIVADRFRLFDPDVEPNGKPLFATGTVDGTSQIYMNANNIAMIADNPSLSTENFFELSGEGLSINTPGLKLDKDGNAIFNGEISSNQFSLNSNNLTINEEGISTDEFTLNSLNGSAEFSGNLQSASGKLGNNDNYINFDGTDLEINTDTFMLNKDGSINIFGKKNLTIDLNDTSPFIRMEDDLGNYTILDSGHLKFYEAGEDFPYWYSKRTKYGTVPSGTYIDLTNSSGEVTWKTKPKVQTSIASIQTFYPQETTADVYYECFATDITKEGFTVIGQAYAPVGDGNSLEQTYSIDYSENIYPNYETGSDVTRVDLRFKHTIGGSYDNINMGLFYRSVGSSTWNNFASYDAHDPSPYLYTYNYRYTFTDLPLNNYEFKFESSGDPATVEISIDSKKYEYIDQGEVVYMALEGGTE